MIMAFSFIDSKITINHPKHFWYESCNKRIYEEIAKFEINQWEDSILKGSPLIGWRFGFLSRLTEWGGGCESDWVGERLRDCRERRWECHLAEIWFIFQLNLPRWQIGLGVLHINQTTFSSWEPGSLLLLNLKNENSFYAIKLWQLCKRLNACCSRKRTLQGFLGWIYMLFEVAGHDSYCLRRRFRSVFAWSWSLMCTLLVFGFDSCNWL